MSWKDDFISKHGKAAYEKKLARMRAYNKAHRVEDNARNKKWRESHPEEVIAKLQEACRKGGKYYDKVLAYNQTGIPGERHKIREKHGRQYRPYKRIIAPDSELHHTWIPNTAKYTGLALVERDKHRHGIIDPIQILEGEITLFSEEEIRNGGKCENILKR